MLFETIKSTAGFVTVGIDTPLPEQVKQARTDAGLSRLEAAKLVHASYRTWQDWELGNAKINLAAWELFLIKINQTRRLKIH